MQGQEQFAREPGGTLEQAAFVTIHTGRNRRGAWKAIHNGGFFAPRFLVQYTEKFMRLLESQPCW